MILVKKLNELQAGNVGKVQSIGGDVHFQSRITSIGLTPGSIVEIVQNKRKRPLLIYSRDSLIAINRKDAELIEMKGN
ncbi:FeoA family protein [Syntrophobotulus glycolicus]|uniref:FeoA family protein n=1 Tax=Syntrophobotulus glycolicus TaxID=51197 RepID=UPI003D035176